LPLRAAPLHAANPTNKIRNSMYFILLVIAQIFADFAAAPPLA
jgi:hypothetical protein